MNRPLYAVVCFTALITPILASTGSQAHPVTAPSPVAAPSIQDPAVNRALKVLDRLRAVGYRWTTDQGAVKAIRAWQKANGLVVDGIPGVQTAKSLGLGPQTAISVTQTPKGAKNAPKPPDSSQNSPKTPVEPLNIAPATPVSTTDACTEMSQYRQAAGLPEQFDQIGYRESRCNNSVGNACCHAWWANYLSSHLSSQSAYRDRIINECGVTQVSDIRGDSDAQKRASACVTFVVWSISGMSPWRL